MIFRGCTTLQETHTLPLIKTCVSLGRQCPSFLQVGSISLWSHQGVYPLARLARSNPDVHFPHSWPLVAGAPKRAGVVVVVPSLRDPGENCLVTCCSSSAHNGRRFFSIFGESEEGGEGETMIFPA